MSQDLNKIKHSTAHLIAAAVLKLYPKTKLAIGPAIEDGFYYDFDFKEKISEEDLIKIEKETEKLIKANLVFKKKKVDPEKALELFKNQPFKLELIKQLKKEGEKEITLYESGDFTDLCQGPHVEKSSQIGAFKLLSLAGAYWKGDEKKPMLTRIYGVAFKTKAELKKYLQQLEEAKKRDHRKLNRDLKIYQTSDLLGTGLVTLLPKGTIIAEELENWAKETEKKQGYVHVLSPNIAKEDLFKKTGHIPYYSENMYPPMRMEEKGQKEKGNYYLKPMNCSFHALVFKSEPRSYRDLPLRVAEYGTVYRYEKSGELHGMMRVRGPIHQNDGHIFCTEEQAEGEFQKVMDLHLHYYNSLGLTKKDYFLSFATRDKENKEKYLGSDQMWEKAERIALGCIKKSKLPYEIEEGGAAFYGPKIDFNIKTVTGKSFSASTNQLDYFIPKAFDLRYTTKNGQLKTPVIIHRAPLGAHVRFIAFLMEHFAGAFPTWLSPIQAIILPITDDQLDFAQKIAKQLKETKIRTEINDDSEPIGAKIRKAEKEKIPFILVIGQKEVDGNQVNLRKRGGHQEGAKDIQEIIKLIRKEIDNKL